MRNKMRCKLFVVFILFSTIFFSTLVFADTTVNRGTKFRLNIGDVLTVSVQLPNSWASGEAGNFLKNKILVSASTNSLGGLTASMSTKTPVTALTNISKSSEQIQTFDESMVTESTFPSGRWGFTTSLGGDTNSNTTYNRMVGSNSTPSTIFSTNYPGFAETYVIFAAKSSSNMAPGIYANTVVINVVTGTITEDNPIRPENPATPSNNSDPTYNPENGTSVTTIASNPTTTTETTKVGSVDVTDEYADPQGVSTTSENEEILQSGSSIATSVAIASAVAATTGTIFFILAKRRKDDEEEEEE